MIEVRSKTDTDEDQGIDDVGMVLMGMMSRSESPEELTID